MSPISKYSGGKTTHAETDKPGKPSLAGHVRTRTTHAMTDKPGKPSLSCHPFGGQTTHAETDEPFPVTSLEVVVYRLHRDG